MWFVHLARWNLFLFYPNCCSSVALQQTSLSLNTERPSGLLRYALLTRQAWKFVSSSFAIKLLLWSLSRNTRDTPSCLRHLICILLKRPPETFDSQRNHVVLFMFLVCHLREVSQQMDVSQRYPRAQLRYAAWLIQHSTPQTAQFNVYDIWII